MPGDRFEDSDDESHAEKKEGQIVRQAGYRDDENEGEAGAEYADERSLESLHREGKARTQASNRNRYHHTLGRNGQDKRGPGEAVPQHPINQP